MIDHENDDLDDELEGEDTGGDGYDGEAEDENEDAEEEDRGPGWYEHQWGGLVDDEEDRHALESEIEDSEYEDGGGIVTNIPLVTPTGRQSYQNVCWKCTHTVDDECLPRCSTGCGWLRCQCGSCLCDMPKDRRLKRPYGIRIKYIASAARHCPNCRGICFAPSDQERRQKEQLGKDYVIDPAQYSSCSECAGRGYVMA